MTLIEDERANTEFMVSGLKALAVAEGRLRGLTSSEWEWVGDTAAHLYRARLCADMMAAAGLPMPEDFSSDLSSPRRAALDILSRWPESHAGTWQEVEDFAPGLLPGDILLYRSHGAALVMQRHLGEHVVTVTLEGHHWPVVIPNGACVTFHRVIEDSPNEQRPDA